MYKIGEFATIVGTTTKTLRYYDDEGILKPDYVDQTTGYRYYGVFKISEYNRIATLKDLGFSLAEIKEAATSKSDVEVLELIRNKKNQLISEANGLSERIASVTKMEEAFMSLVKVFEDQSQYRNKIETDSTSIRLFFQNHETIEISYECSSRDDVYFTSKLFLEALNGFGLVKTSYSEIKKLLTVGDKVYIYKVTPQSIQMYNDRDAKGFVFGFSIGSGVTLIEIALIMEEFADKMSEDALAMFTAIIDPELEAKAIEIALLNIK